MMIHWILGVAWGCPIFKPTYYQTLSHSFMVHVRTMLLGRLCTSLEARHVGQTASCWEAHAYITNNRKIKGCSKSRSRNVYAHFFQQSFFDHVEESRQGGNNQIPHRSHLQRNKNSLCRPAAWKGLARPPHAKTNGIPGSGWGL